MKSSTIIPFAKIILGVGIAVFGTYYGIKLASSGVTDIIHNYNPQDAAIPVFANEWRTIARILFEIQRLTPYEYTQLCNYQLSFDMQIKSSLLQTNYPGLLTSIDSDNVIKYILMNQVTQYYPIIDYLNYS